MWLSGVAKVAENREGPISRDHCQLKGSANKGGPGRADSQGPRSGLEPCRPVHCSRGTPRCTSLLSEDLLACSLLLGGSAGHNDCRE